MTEINQRLRDLYQAYIDNEASADQLIELNELVSDPEQDPELTALLEELWDETEESQLFFSKARSNEMFRNIYIPPTSISWWRRRRSLVATISAAALLIGGGFSMLFYATQRKAKDNVGMVAAPFKDVLPGGNHATLTLGNGKRINLEGANAGILSQEGGVAIFKSAKGELIFNFSKGRRATDHALMNALNVPAGGQYQLVLSDGSRVWVNSTSVIKFPSVFSGNVRQVELTGEAYFEVARMTGKPFKVRAGSQEIEVLDTHFNVKAYPEEGMVKTTLLEGSVSLSSKLDRQLLKPGQQGQLFESGRINVLHDVNMDLEIAWKDGFFRFDDARVEEVMRQVARWYDVDIRYEGRIPEKRFTGTISRNVNASEFLNMFSYTGLKFRISNKTITVLNP